MPLTVIKNSQLGKRARNHAQYESDIDNSILKIWNRNKTIDKDVLRGIIVGKGKINKSTRDKVQTTLNQMEEGTFNPNRKFAKNKQWQEFKKSYNKSFMDDNNLLKKSKLREMMKSHEYQEEMFKRYVKHVERLENYKNLKTEEDVDTVKTISEAFGRGNRERKSTVKHIQKTILNKGYSNIEKKARLQQDIETVRNGEALEGHTMAESKVIAQGMMEFISAMA